MYGTAETYSWYMTEMSVTAARDHLADVIDSARVQHEAVVLTRRGRRVAVILGTEEHDRLVELAEDALDLAEARAALVEGGEPISWEKIKADLGL